MTMKPRVCIVDALVGRHPGRVTTQGLVLWDRLAAAGYEVIAVSTAQNRYARLAEIVATIVRRHREIDVLVVFSYGRKAFVVEDVATLLGKQFGIPILISPCSGALPSFMQLFPRWTRRVFARAELLVCQSDFLARTLRSHRHDIVPNIIDLRDYAFRHRPAVAPRMLWMRTFEDLYNPLLALRTFARVRARHPRATLVLAGQDAPFRRVVDAKIRELGLAGAVRLPGFLDATGKQREADRADIFLNTPRIDNRPVTVVEAAAFGLPVVTTDVGGMRDLVTHEHDALFVPSNDDRAMADAVLRLVAEPALAATLSRNGRALAEDSAVERVLPRWEQIFRATARRAA